MRVWTRSEKIQKKTTTFTFCLIVKGAQENTPWFQVVFLFFWRAWVQPGLLTAPSAFLSMCLRAWGRRIFLGDTRSLGQALRSPWVPVLRGNLVPGVHTLPKPARIPMPPPEWVASTMQLLSEQVKGQHKHLRPSGDICEKIRLDPFLSFYSVPNFTPRHSPVAALLCTITSTNECTMHA